jgi:hypothetical protein
MAVDYRNFDMKPRWKSRYHQIFGAEPEFEVVRKNATAVPDSREIERRRRARRRARGQIRDENGEDRNPLDLQLRRGPPRLAQGVGTRAMDEEGLPVVYPVREFADGGSTSPDDFLSDGGVTDAEEEDLADEAEEAIEEVDEEQKEKTMATKFDAVTFAKRVAKDGVSAISEAEATDLIKTYANAHRLAGENASAAFARIYTGNDDVGLSFRKMVQMAKGIAHPHV